MGKQQSKCSARHTEVSKLVANVKGLAVVVYIELKLCKFNSGDKRLKTPPRVDAAVEGLLCINGGMLEPAQPPKAFKLGCMKPKMRVPRTDATLR